MFENKSIMFLPVTKQELIDRGVYAPDFVVVSGDAYVDHPSFGHAIIGRLLEDEGFSVGVIAQPVTDAEFTEFGAPKIAFMVSGGAVDGMVNNYTVAKNRRKEDDYSDRGVAGRRPDRTLTVYCKKLKSLFPKTPVVIGGIEASLRRIAHYDYWADTVMPSILQDTGADLLVYGMGEKPLLEIMRQLKRRVPLKRLKDIRGAAYLTALQDAPDEIKTAVETGFSENFVMLNSYERVKEDKRLYAQSFAAFSRQCGSFGKGLVQKQENGLYAVINPPAKPLTTEELDRVYELPYMRDYHPKYKNVPSIEEVKFSLVSHRGCFGNCAFCALNAHQGREIAARSHRSVIAEAVKLTQMPGFKGYIHDVGGPSANFRRPSCKAQKERGVCKDKNCIGFKACENLEAGHGDYLALLRALRAVPKVKKVFIRSGIRFDYLLMDRDKSFFNELVEHHISGQLKVAPEHISDAVLKIMNKPPHETYLRFVREFNAIDAARQQKTGNKPQFIVPYFISSHPGSTLADAVALAEYLKSIRYNPQQVQDFYPTPSTLATTIYYTGLDPFTMAPVFTEKDEEGKAMQRALLQFNNPKNRRLVEKALRLTGRVDLIGYGPKCLIRPFSSTRANGPNPKQGKWQG